MYVYWLEKPYGVREKIRFEKGHELRTFVQVEDEPEGSSMFTAFTILVFTSTNQTPFIKSIERSKHQGTSILHLIAASALSSWNVPFPGNSICVLWKVVSVGTAVFLIATIFTYW